MSRTPNHEAPESVNDGGSSNNKGKVCGGMPLVFLEGAVLFPHNVIVVPSLEGFSLQDLGESEFKEFRVLVTTSSENELAVGLQLEKDSPDGGFWVSKIATMATITGVTKVGSGQLGLVLKGRRPCILERVWAENRRYHAEATKLPLPTTDSREPISGGRKLLKTLALDMLRSSPLGSQELISLFNSTDDPVVLSYLIIPSLNLELSEKLQLLFEQDLLRLIEVITGALMREKEFSKLVAQVQEKVKADISDNMRKNFLREQLEGMKRELNSLEGVGSDADEFKKMLSEKDVPDTVAKEIIREIDRLEMMPAGSPEYMICHNFIETALGMPWGLDNTPMKSMAEATQILEKDHFGLVKVKERILDYVALLTHIKKTPPQILLLVGPPGVGKTSLVKSIAECLSRPFARLSLGGVEDVAEIRGHRRTYIGAMPGKIIESIRKAESMSPVILLDEIDKTGKSHRGDVSSALLEVLDPSQNESFVDHFLGFPYDLSNVVFVATANSTSTIPKPLLDRMEVIEVSGYSEDEKIRIAKRHLIPGLIKEYDLPRSYLNLSQTLLQEIIRNYTMESGVRSLKRKLSELARKGVAAVVSEHNLSRPDVELIRKILGPPYPRAQMNFAKLPFGVAIGLAYTQLGGETLLVETADVSQGDLKSQAKFKMTGSLGEVMQESASIARAFLFANASELGIDGTRVGRDVHIHFPEGAVPKDGPSAGVALLAALYSLYLKRPLLKKIAMTGEITLRGDVLPVGGIKEKVLAAHRAGVRKVIIPKANLNDLSELPMKVLDKTMFFPVSKMLDVLRITGLVSDKSHVEFQSYGHLLSSLNSGGQIRQSSTGYLN